MVMSNKFYKSPEKLALKKRLKELKAAGEAPPWLNWISLQKLQGGYLWKDETPRAMYRRVASVAASYLPEDQNQWEEKFFDLFWKNFSSH